MTARFVFAVIITFLPISAFAAQPDYQTLFSECFEGNKESCLAGAKIASLNKEFRDSADLAIRGCSHGLKEACELQVVAEAKDGNVDGFLKALSNACVGNVGRYCSISDDAKLKLFETNFKSADPSLYETWRTGARGEDIKKIDPKRAESIANAELNKVESLKQSLLKQCDSGKNASCIKAGKNLLVERSFAEALEVLEKACDRKSAEACEMAGMAALSLEQGDYAISLVGIACKLGRLSSCRLQGKVSQEVKSRDLAIQEARREKIALDIQIERDRIIEERNAAEAAEQERIDRRNQAKRDDALVEAARQVGEAISGANYKAPNKNRRTCRQKQNPYGGHWETVCEDSDF